MAGEQTIDLTKPGELWARAENEKDITFHLVLPLDQYNQAQLAKNPQIKPQHELMPPFTVPFARANQDGVCVCDLAVSGRARAAIDAIDAVMRQGGAVPEKIRAVYIATARAGNRIPEARAVEVQDFKLAPLPAIVLKGSGKPVEVKPHTEGTYVTVKQFKAGKKFHEAEFTTQGMTEVRITTSPAAQIQVEGGRQGNGMLTMAVERGKTYKVKVATSHKITGKQTRAGQKTFPVFSRWIVRGGRTGAIAEGEYDKVRGGWKCKGETESNMVRRPCIWPSYWNRWVTDTCFDAKGVAWQFKKQTLDLWSGGTTVLRVAGTGDNQSVVQSINLESAAFASEADWADGPPPPALAHNNC